MREHLCQAIHQRQVLYFRYSDGRLRVVEPHAFWLSPTGRPLLRAFQRSGFSVSGQPRGWKTFRADRIMSVEDSGQLFSAPREGYDPFSGGSVGRFLAMIPPDLPDWMRHDMGLAAS